MQKIRPYLKMTIRAQHGTQRAFARRCERSDSWISDYVTARRHPNEANKDLICSKLTGADDDPRLFIVSVTEQLEFDYGGKQ